MNEDEPGRWVKRVNRSKGVVVVGLDRLFVLGLRVSVVISRLHKENVLDESIIPRCRYAFRRGKKEVQNEEELMTHVGVTIDQKGVGNVCVMFLVGVSYDGK